MLLLLRYSLAKERLQGVEVVMVEHVCATQYVAPTLGVWYATGMSTQSRMTDSPAQPRGLLLQLPASAHC